MREILTKTCFSPQVSHIQLKYAFLLFWSIFGEIHREHLFLFQIWLSQKGAQKNSESFFSLRVWKGAHPEKNLDLFKQLFLIKPLKWDKYKKKLVFLLKVNNIQLKYAFQLFWSILGEIHRELLFLVQKVTISEKSTEILRKFVFLTSLKRANPEENLDLFKQDQILGETTFFSSKRELNLCFFF